MAQPATSSSSIPASASDADPKELQPSPLDTTSPQLTIRAVATGMILGGTLSICNVYTGLKIGWGTNMSITGILLAFAFWGVITKLSAGKVRQFNVLENNINQAACSAAAAVSSAGLVSAIPALTILTGIELTWAWLSVWLFSVCAVGVAVATGLRRQMIVVDKLPFPGGLSCAQTLREIYAAGSEAFARVGAMVLGAVVAGSVKVAEIAGLVKMWAPANASVKGHSLGALTFQVEPTLMFYAVGGLVSWKAAWSLMLGAILAWLVLAPNLINDKLVSLTSRETLAALPADLELVTGERLRYNDARRELTYSGVMSESQREDLLLRSQSVQYQEAIAKLYAESQLRVAAPLAAEPAGVDWSTLPVRYDASAKELIATRAFSRDDETKLRAVSNEPQYQAAIARLASHFGWSVTRAYTVRVALPEGPVPKGFFVPKDYTGIMRITPGSPAQLVITGAMPESAQESLLKKLDALRSVQAPGQAGVLDALTKAVREGFAASRSATLPAGLVVPEALAHVLEIDPQQRTLSVKGAPGAGDIEQMRKLSEDPTYQATLNNALASASFTPARANFTDITDWLLWPGTVLMVVSALVSFLFSWKSIARSFRFGKARDEPVVDTGEVSRAWFLWCLTAALVFSTALQVFLFQIQWWAAAVGVLMSFVLAVVASRVSGETNVTPVGAMGKVTQLFFGVIAPKDPSANLMSANVTAGAASQCADLMHDFKCGYLLGGMARKQAVGQILGCLAGSIVGSAFYLILIPNPKEQLFTDEWPAPAVAVWKAVAEVFQVGLSNLPPFTVEAMAIAGAIGVVLPVLERFGPKWLKPFVPSPASVGLAFVIRANTAISMFIGALVAMLLNKLFPRWSERFLVTICAGIVAGESLVGAGDAVRRVLFG